MKTLKKISQLLFVSILLLTSCQDEIDSETGENPNTNSANSQTASNLERSSRSDGSFDDFIDGTSCSSLLLPVVATVNGTQVTIISESDYSTVIDILAQFTNDDDSVTLQFPVTVMLSNYTEVVVTNQSEYDDIIAACETLESTGQDAINCLEINFPISILTFNATQEQTGSAVLESDAQLFNFMNNLEDDDFFSVNYPITAMVSGSSTTTITSDMDLQFAITDCLGTEDEMEDAEEDAEELTEILVDGLFRVESFVNTGVDTANDFADFTIDFANDLTVTAENNVSTIVDDAQGTYEVASETDVFLSMNFSGNTTIELLNDTWEVTAFNASSISIQSSTNSAVTVILNQI